MKRMNVFAVWFFAGAIRHRPWAFLVLWCLCAGAPFAAAQPSAEEVLTAPAAEEQEVESSGDGTPFSCAYCDLSGADLAGRDMRNGNLVGANLSRANLQGAQMDGVMLVGANLTGANLSNARLNPSEKARANLSRANLTGANLTGAELNGADLQFARLPGADLTRVDLTRATLGPRLLAGVDATGRRTSLRGARLPAGLLVEEAAADLTAVEWVGDRSRAAADEEIVCGRADLTPLTSRVYVASTGTDGATCGATPQAPCKTIAFAIGRCAGAGCGVLAAWDVYPTTATVALRDGVNVYGGCLPKSQARPDYFSVITAPPAGKPAVSADGLRSATLLQGFQLAATDATGTNAATSVALQVQNSSGLAVLDTELVAAQGGQGAQGGPGAAGTAGGNGSGRNPGTVSACANTSGGQGSVQMDVTVDNGVFSFTCKPSCSANGCYGYTASRGTTSQSAGGGGWGKGNCAECPQSRGEKGTNGGGGANAACGARGTASADLAGRFNGAVWVAGTGGPGTTGGDGGGGGGGGAGGYKAGSCFWVKTQDKGNSGGGGGAGGCRGGGGGGGQQGGASFALVAVSSTVTLTRCEVIGGSGGTGGRGGNGGQAGKGGSGAGGATDQGGGYGGTGGGGGAGGAGGGGAGGNGGPAVGAALVSGATLNQTDVVFYRGRSGTVGAPGTGGTPIVSGACLAPDGTTGQNGLVENTKAY